MSNILWSHQEPEDAQDPHANFPAVSLDLVEALEREYPDRSPSPDASDRAIWMAVGQARLVAFLREMSNRVPTMKEKN
jgi:hypothetical protein